MPPKASAEEPLCAMAGWHVERPPTWRRAWRNADLSSVLRPSYLVRKNDHALFPYGAGGPAGHVMYLGSRRPDIRP